MHIQANGQVMVCALFQCACVKGVDQSYDDDGVKFIYVCVSSLVTIEISEMRI